MTAFHKPTIKPENYAKLLRAAMVLVYTQDQDIPTVPVLSAEDFNFYSEEARKYLLEAGITRP